MRSATSTATPLPSAVVAETDDAGPAPALPLYVNSPPPDKPAPPVRPGPPERAPLPDHVNSPPPSKPALPKRVNSPPPSNPSTK